ncbi:Pectinesterase inhibitor domain [Dillenia turbinata]|uniref:Pectinesterase inhibitor domain n=1 Tax=Dillenia turbinata TaxID=194707 RepID=A0AAN8ZUT7_9MAGN
MARANLSCVLLIFVIYTVGLTEFTSAGTAAGMDFIRASCATTRYATLCVQSLTPYANAIGQDPQRLAKAALSVSLNNAQSCSAFVSNLAKSKGLNSRAYLTVQDCINQVGDSVNRLGNAMQELGNLSPSGRQDFTWHMSNVQTWTSAALTDANTCLDEFSHATMDAKVHATTRARVQTIAQYTSNALALVNRFAAKHHKGYYTCD